MINSNRPFVFGVSQYTTWHNTFDADIKLYSELDVDTVEVCEFKLDLSDAEARMAQIAQSGLSVSSVQPTVHTIFPDTLARQPADPQARVDLIRRCIGALAPHVPRDTPFVVNTGVAPNGNFRDALKTTVEQIRMLADFAGNHGMRIAIEPLHPILMNKNSFIWSIPQALDIISQVEQENFGVCLDTWNIWQEPNVIEHIAACEDRIFVVQVSDWHAPRSFADRAIVGEGQIPTRDLLRAIDRAGYKGAYTLEIFSDDALPDSLWKADGYRVIQESKAALLKSMPAAPG